MPVKLEIRFYQDINGKIPYLDWLRNLKNLEAKRAIIRSIQRMELGNFGYSQSIGDGVYELRLHLGAGYRIYYFYSEKEIVLLLNGGDKSSQNKDIIKAKEYKQDYQRRVI